ncbi:glycosyltransferase family 4 protein [Marinoscillum sp. MHG1-6]|uniref:glycosyltransferase family 4 protein n=1 Tax=Marinoscillum sp. MHG1-6 TaxID=2959627 RepID=UPI002157942D|nr:glycosyltransferase family 4 protein [Marinoscillum sp. MHG1-6]
MKILMLGWELPPIISGGLGVASEGITNGMVNLGHKVEFLLPKKNRAHKNKPFKVIDSNAISLDFKLWQKEVKVTEIIRETEVAKRLIPYLPAEVFEIARKKQIVIEKLEDKQESALLDKVELTGEYTKNLLSETSKYALLAAQHCLKNKYDIIHAHDWVVFKAGALCAKETGLPLYVHCHSTEYDRNGSYAQEDIIREEKLGFEASTKIFSVSEMVKRTIVSKYKINPKKIVVVPNALEEELASVKKASTKKKKTIIFVGRFTHQKGPFVFVDIARELLNKGGDYEFIMIGDGYLKEQLIRKVNHLNLSDRFEFPGFLVREKALEQLQKADLLIAPSYAEPFGLVILEAILNKVPVLAAKGTGISEFVPGLVQIELWDTFNFIQKASRLLKDVPYKKEVVDLCLSQASKLSWEKSAKIIEKAYAS